MLTDTGPLVALLDQNDRKHGQCIALMQTLMQGPLWTTWPCMTEAFYLLDGLGGYRYQDRLWRLRRDSRLYILDLTEAETDRMDVLMKKYQDVPMDFADASLVATAESRKWRRLFTIDRDFYIYRLADGTMLDVVP